MTTSNYVYLKNSKFISISGNDKNDFLQGLITNDINKCTKDNPIYSCMLTPQGKFLADFFIFNYEKKFLIEIHNEFVNRFIDKLKIYKLKSDIHINKENFVSLYVLSDKKEIKFKENIILFNDPRKNNLGIKIILKENQLKKIVKDNNLKEIEFIKYREILIKNLIPYSPEDLDENKSLLLENNFQNINAIDWDKGCYVGQEITARMQYRALLKKRIYVLKIKSGQIDIGDKLINNDLEIGTVISKTDHYLLAMLKINLAEKSIKNKISINTSNSGVVNFIK